MTIIEETPVVTPLDEPADPFRDEPYEAALEYCNMIRQEWGLNELDHLYPGRAGDNQHCPIAETLNAEGGSDAYYTVTVGGNATYLRPTDSYKRLYEHTALVKEFIGKVDRIGRDGRWAYPELVTR